MTAEGAAQRQQGGDDGGRHGQRQQPDTHPIASDDVSDDEEVAQQHRQVDGRPVHPEEGGKLRLVGKLPLRRAVKDEVDEVITGER